MEERIFEILTSMENDSSRSCAKEITSHIMEFIEWLIRQKIYYYNTTTQSWETYTVANVSWNEVYLYWINDVKHERK